MADSRDKIQGLVFQCVEISDLEKLLQKPITNAPANALELIKKELTNINKTKASNDKTARLQHKITTLKQTIADGIRALDSQRARASPY